MHPALKLALTISAGMIVFSTVIGIAASMTISSSDVGAGAASVGSCDTDGVTTSYTVSYSAPTGGYAIATVKVGGISTPGCDGRTMKVTLVGANDASLAEQTLTLATPAADPSQFDFTASSIAASAVLKVAVVVY